MFSGAKTLPASSSEKFLSTYGYLTAEQYVRGIGVTQEELSSDDLRIELEMPSSFVKKTLEKAIGEAMDLHEAESELIKFYQQLMRQGEANVADEDMEEVASADANGELLTAELPSQGKSDQVNSYEEWLKRLQDDQTEIIKQYREAKAKVVKVQEEIAEKTERMADNMAGYFQKQAQDVLKIAQTCLAEQKGDKDLDQVKFDKVREEVEEFQEALKREQKAQAMFEERMKDKPADEARIMQTSQLNQRLVLQQIKLNSTLTRLVEYGVLPESSSETKQMTKQSVLQDYEKKYKDELQPLASVKAKRAENCKEMRKLANDYAKVSKQISIANDAITHKREITFVPAALPLPAPR